MNMVTVYRALSPADAQLVRSRLDAAEFDVIVTHELAAMNIDGYALAAGGVLVQVPEDQSADARALLVAEPPPSSESPPPLP